MKYDAITKLRDQVQGYHPLNDWLTGLYGRAAAHIVGLKRARRTEHFPYCCYIPGRETREHAMRQRELDVHIVFGIMQPHKADNIYSGVSQLAQFGEYILDAIMSDCSLGTDFLQVMPQIETATDFGLRHPIYEAEITLAIKVRE